MWSEDITFCANQACEDMTCKRNSKHIKLQIPHAFSLFSQCPKWNDDGAKWLTKQMTNEED